MPAKIAVVNDDTQFLHMMHILLEEAGYDASNSFEQGNAFENMKQQQPDVIVLDIRMESPDGGWVLLDLVGEMVALGTRDEVIAAPDPE